MEEAYAQLKNKTLAITGANGFIGRRLAEIILEKLGPNVEIKGLDVSPLDKDSPLNASENYKHILGSIESESDVNSLVQGVDIVFHTAAIVKEDGNFELFRKINVEGTKRTAICAANCGVEVFVQLSSVMVYGYIFPDRIEEDGPKRGENNPYCVTKIESEKVLLEMISQGTNQGMKIVIIRPGDVYGPRSVPWIVKPLQLMKMLGVFLLPSGNGIINHVFVENLVDGMILVTHRGENGEAYNITDDQRTTWMQFYRNLSKRCLGHQRVFALPKAVLWILFWIQMFFFSIVIKFRRALGLQRNTPNIDVTTTAFHFTSRPQTYSIEKIKKLGFLPLVTLEDGLDRTASWFSKTEL